MRIMPAAALLLLLLVSPAEATSNTSDRWERKRSEEETRRIFTEWKARHGTTDSSLTEEEEEHVYAMFKKDFCHNDQLWHDDGYSVLSWERGMSEEETRQIFGEWKVVRNNKTYSSIAHEEKHGYTIFKEALRDIDRHNAIGVPSNNPGIDQFSDHTQE